MHSVIKCVGGDVMKYKKVLQRGFSKFMFRSLFCSRRHAIFAWAGVLYDMSDRMRSRTPNLKREVRCSWKEAYFLGGWSGDDE